jgi:hypothetical protein
MVFSFAAASEEGENDAPFNPPTMHATAELAAYCATIIGRLQHGTVTLQVGGVAEEVAVAVAAASVVHAVLRIF